MIVSFKDADTKRLWDSGASRRIPAKIRRVASRKLAMLNNVKEVELLRVPPANRLEKLSGDRRGQYSIRVNDNTAFALFGVTEMRIRLRLWTITERARRNPWRERKFLLSIPGRFCGKSS
jgi:proteic killer suppression protein